MRAGLRPANLALALGLIHNSQEEFFLASSGRLDLVYCALVFGGWFVGSALLVLLLSLLATEVWRGLHRSSS